MCLAVVCVEAGFSQIWSQFSSECASFKISDLPSLMLPCFINAIETFKAVSITVFPA